MSTSKPEPGISQRTEDAIVNLVCTRLAERQTPSGKSVLRELEELAPAEDWALIEASLKRHARRMRAEGRPGW